MTKKSKVQRSKPKARPLGKSSTPYIWLLLCSGAFYLVTLALCARTVGYETLTLDDANMLRAFAEATSSDIFGYDPFGHLRPGKNLLFTVVAQSPELLSWCRGLVLGAFLLSIGLVQRLASTVLASPWWGLAVAVAFALNPTTASSIAWLSASNYVLCLLFILLYIFSGNLALGGGIETPVRKQTWLRFAAIACLIIGTMHLELTLLAPIVLVAYRYSIGLKPWLDRKGALLVIGGAVLCLAILLSLRLFATPPALTYRMAEYQGSQLMLSAARYLWSNLRLWAWQPGYFGVLWTDNPAGHVGWSIASWIALLALAAATFWMRRKDRSSWVAIVWALLFLLPVTNIIPLGTTPVAVHYLYLPGVGLSLLIVRACQRLSHLLSATSWKRAPLVAYMLLILLWLPEYNGTVKLWKDEGALYAASLDNHPDNIEVRANLSGHYLDSNQLKKATALLKESLAMAPQDPVLIKNRFEQLWQTGPASQALSFLDKHKDLRGADYLYRRGKLLELTGKPAEAIESYHKAATQAKDPDLRFMAGIQRARLLYESGDAEEGKRVLEGLIQEFPDRPELKLLDSITHKL